MSQNRLFGIFPREFTMRFARNKNQNKSTPFNLIVHINLRSDKERSFRLGGKAIVCTAIAAAFSPTLIATANGRLPEHILSNLQKFREAGSAISCLVAANNQEACVQEIIDQRPR